MRHKSFKANACPVARSLDTIGEWWSLLIVRDALGGIRRFSDFQKSWDWQKNVLSTRLKKLVACGIPGTGAGFGRQCLPGICPNPKRPRVVPGHRCFASVGESYLFSRGEKRLQVLDKRTGKPFRVQVHNAKGEILTAHESGNWLLLRIE